MKCTHSVSYSDPMMYASRIWVQSWLGYFKSFRFYNVQIPDQREAWKKKKEKWKMTYTRYFDYWEWWLIAYYKATIIIRTGSSCHLLEVSSGFKSYHLRMFKVSASYQDTLQTFLFFGGYQHQRRGSTSLP